jgi:rare lipoprotein A
LKFASACNWFKALAVHRMSLRWVRLAIVFFATSCLAACITAPQSSTALPKAGPTASSIFGSKSSSTAAIVNKADATEPTPTPPVGASPAGTSTVASPESPATDTSGTELLAGEPTREFERGIASWYGPGFHGRRTASGERFDTHAFTAAHRTLPFGTWVRVKNLVNGREADVRITDRGPFSRSRVIDLSRAAAEALGILGAGFRDVVLFVPESTSAVVESASWLAKGKGRRRADRRAITRRIR